MARPTADKTHEYLQVLAELGGKLTTEDDIVFKGKQFILPAHLTLKQSHQAIGERVEEEELDVNYGHTFNYRPMDGARATAMAIKHLAGFSLGEKVHPFFGRRPPELIDVRTGPHPRDVEQVPWGAMRLPGMEAVTFYLGETGHPELGRVFHITAQGPRLWRYEVQGLFVLIEQFLGEHSIYRGKAIDGGEQFIDVSVVDARDVVFTESVQERLMADVWALIRHEKVLASLGQGGKFAALFEGDYGTGKSLAAILTAQVALECGWTFVMCRPGKDNFVNCLQLALMYQPAVFFSEDLDVTAGPQSGDTIERNLDVIDGIKTKGLKLLSVFTTNHPEDIHKGMLRAKRIGSVIRFGAMDRPGLEKLAQRVIGDNLDPEADFDKVYEACEGYMPAFVREVFDRAVRYSVAFNEGELGPIGTRELTRAAEALRDQYQLMTEAKEDRPQSDLSAALVAAVAKAIDGTNVIDCNDDIEYVLSRPNGGA